MAAVRAMSFAQELGVSEFMLEGDSEMVINSLRSKEASYLLLAIFWSLPNPY